MPSSLYSGDRAPVPIVEEAGWASGLMWMGVEGLAPSELEP